MNVVATNVHYREYSLVYITEKEMHNSFDNKKHCAVML